MFIGEYTFYSYLYLIYIDDIKKTMFKKFVIASAIILLLPVAIVINDQIKIKDYLPITQQTHEYSAIDFNHYDKIIDPKIINYIHTRLDHRLAYEDEFKNNIVLSNFTSSEEDMPYNILAEVRDNIQKEDDNFKSHFRY